MKSQINFRFMFKIKTELRNFVIFRRLLYNKGLSLFIRKRLIHKGYQLLTGSMQNDELVLELIDNFNTKVELYKHILKNKHKFISNKRK